MNKDGLKGIQALAVITFMLLFSGLCFSVSVYLGLFIVVVMNIGLFFGCQHLITLINNNTDEES